MKCDRQNEGAPLFFCSAKAKINLSRAWGHMLLMPACDRQRPADLCELNANLLCIESSRPAGAGLHSENLSQRRSLLFPYVFWSDNGWCLEPEAKFEVQQNQGSQVYSAPGPLTGILSFYLDSSGFKAGAEEQWKPRGLFLPPISRCAQKTKGLETKWKLFA